MKVPDLNFWEPFKKASGAFSAAEAIALHNICLEAPNGLYLELGTHKGKSTMAAVSALKDGFFSLVDPIFEDEEIIREVVSNVSRVNKNSVQLNFIINYSTNVIQNYENLSYVFVDSGSHGDGLPMEEVKMLEDRVKLGGIIAFHDIFSQFTEVTEAYEYLIGTDKYDVVQIDWHPILEYVKDNALDIGNNSWHQYPELPHSPNFVGALRRKSKTYVNQK